MPVTRLDYEIVLNDLKGGSPEEKKLAKGVITRTFTQNPQVAFGWADYCLFKGGSKFITDEVVDVISQNTKESLNLALKLKTRDAALPSQIIHSIGGNVSSLITYIVRCLEARRVIEQELEDKLLSNPHWCSSLIKELTDRKGSVHYVTVDATDFEHNFFEKAANMWATDQDNQHERSVLNHVIKLVAKKAIGWKQYNATFQDILKNVYGGFLLVNLANEWGTFHRNEPPVDPKILDEIHSLGMWGGDLKHDVTYQGKHDEESFAELMRRKNPDITR